MPGSDIGSRRDGPLTEVVKDKIIEQIPSLRRFARYMARDADHADVAHVRLLAADKRVPVVIDATLPVQAIALIETLA